MKRTDMSRFDLAFLAFFGLYTAVGVFLLLLGIGPALSKSLPAVKDTFQVWGDSGGKLAGLWLGMVEAGHFSEGLARLALDYVFSALNVGLGLFLVWQSPRDKAARLLGIALVGTGVVFNFASHGVLVTTWFFLNPLHVTIHAVSGAAYADALLVFPNGKRSPRWSVWLLVVGYLVMSVGIGSIVISSLGGTLETLGFHGSHSEVYGEIVSTDAVLSLFFFGLLIPIVGIGAQVYRYHAILTSVERQQTKLVVWAIVVAFGAGLLFLVLAVLQGASHWTEIGEAFHELEELVLFNFPFLFATVSVAVVVSILRYRLWDIDLLINRTLVYGALTAALVGTYLGAVIGLQAAFRAVTDQGSAVAVVMSTLAIAALFQPLRRLIQVFIDRRFYRRKYDAALTLAAFGDRIRDEVDLERLREDLVGLVHEAMQPAHTSLWIRQPSARGREGPGAD